MTPTPALPAFPVEGGCACGAVRYRLLEDPLELHACHCTDCQRLTGSAFVLSMPVRRPAVELLRGEPARVEFETVSGIPRCERYCPACGTRIWSEPQHYPDLLTLRPGTLDDTSWLRPIAHIWTHSAQPWVTIPDDVLRYEKEPDDALKLVRAWKSRR